MKITNRPALLESYFNALIDNMTLEDMQELLYAMMESDFERISDEQLIEEIKYTHPELLK
jgi:uncharacterized protein YeeX (DUF496 family)